MTTTPHTSPTVPSIPTAIRPTPAETSSNPPLFTVHLRLLLALFPKVLCTTLGNDPAGAVASLTDLGKGKNAYVHEVEALIEEFGQTANIFKEGFEGDVGDGKNKKEWDHEEDGHNSGGWMYSRGLSASPL